MVYFIPDDCEDEDDVDVSIALTGQNDNQNDNHNDSPINGYNMSDLGLSWND